MNVDLSKLSNAQVVGELLRDLVFDQEGDKVGCYSTFNLREGFKKVEDKNRLSTYENIMSADAVEAYSNGDITVAWFWDGDGCLMFITPEVSVINTDCKKDYTWEFL